MVCCTVIRADGTETMAALDGYPRHGSNVNADGYYMQRPYRVGDQFILDHLVTVTDTFAATRVGSGECVLAFNYR